MSRRVQKYISLRDPNYNKRNLKKEEGIVESGVIKVDEDDGGNPMG